MSSPARALWGMNDATIVYPLPQSPAEMGALPAPEDKGPAGALLPLEYWKRIPTINQGEGVGNTYRNLRAVAVRLDPCFRFDGDCLAQVRLVWQPIDRGGYGTAAGFGLEAKDATVHTFHTLDAATFRRFLGEYEGLVGGLPQAGAEAPLQVHPVMRAQGLGGAFSRDLKRLLLKYCGEENLWRVTFMRTLVGGDHWEFGGFNVVGGKPVDIAIPRTGNATRQGYSVSLISDRDYRNGTISPSPKGEDNLNLLLRDSLSLGSQGEGTLRTLGQSVARIENPDIHTPESMDCVSCHSTQVAGSLLFGRIRWLGRDPAILRYAYRSSSPLQNTESSQNMPRVFRALGYFGRSPVLSRRVINETARAVALLNAGFAREETIPGLDARSGPSGHVSAIASPK